MKIASVGRRSPSALFRKAVASVILLCLAICCVPSTSVAADSGTVIRLSVIDEKNLPVPDATVQVRLSEKLIAVWRVFREQRPAGRARLRCSLLIPMALLVLRDFIGNQ
jgi:hypothetical protein